MNNDGDFLHEKSELSSKFEEIKNQTKRTAANATRAFELSAKALDSAAKGQNSMNDLLDAIEGIRVSSDNISKIIKTIDDIAMQTNLLALNAAVEAAHAGVYGRGFMVVAEEVRNLAGKSKQAADQTKELILDSLEKVKKGVSTAKNSETEIKSVIENVQNVNDVAQEIAKTAAARLAAVERTEEDVLNLESRLRALSEQGSKHDEKHDDLTEDEVERSAFPEEHTKDSHELAAAETVLPTSKEPEPALSKPVAPPSMPSPTPRPELPKPTPRPEPPKLAPKPEPPKPTPRPEPPKPTPRPESPKPTPTPKPLPPKPLAQNPPPVTPKSNRKIDVPSGAHEYDRKDFGKY